MHFLDNPTTLPRPPPLIPRVRHVRVDDKIGQPFSLGNLLVHRKLAQTSN